MINSFYIWIFVTIVFLFSGIKIYLSYQETKNRSVGDFAKYLIFAGLGVLVPVMSYFIGGEILLKAGFVAGVFLKIIGAAFLNRLVMSFFYPKYGKITFYGLLAVNFLVLFVNAAYAKVAYPGFNPQTGSFSWTPPAIVGIMLLLVLLPVFMIPTVLFIKKALSSSDKTVKLRGILVGLGLLFFGVSVSTCGMMTRIVPLFFKNSLVALSALLIFVSIAYVIRKEKMEKILPPSVSLVPPYNSIPVNW
jgi:hypothetical protein